MKNKRKPFMSDYWVIDLASILTHVKENRKHFYKDVEVFLPLGREMDKIEHFKDDLWDLSIESLTLRIKKRIYMKITQLYCASRKVKNVYCVEIVEHVKAPFDGAKPVKVYYCDEKGLYELIQIKIGTA